MRQNTTNTGDGVNRVLGPLVAQKKKTVLAVGLIAMMAFMWIRVLTKDGPEAAEATALTQPAPSEDGSNSQSKIWFVKLPKIKGRHDVITRDVFTPGDWWKSHKGREGQDSSDVEQVEVVSTGGDQEVISLVAAKLKLEAIAFGGSPWAFINGKLLSVGDKLVIKEGTRTFECEVVQIEQNMVVIRCGQAEITLKLKRVTDVSD
jgi:hypothetical protein